MADCSTFDTLVVDWLHDELDPAEAARLTRHVDGCAACWQAAESLVQMRALFRALPEEEPPAAISARVMRQAAAHAASRQRRGLGALTAAWMMGVLGRAWAHPAAAAVASLVLVAGVAGALLARDRLDPAALRLDSAMVDPGETGGGTDTVGVVGGREGGAATPAPAAEAVPPSEMEMAEGDHDGARDRGRPPDMRAQIRDDGGGVERARRRAPARPAQRVKREERELGRGLAARAGDAEEQAGLLAQDAADEVLLDRPGERGGEVSPGGAGGAGQGAFVQAPRAAQPRRKGVAAPAGLDESEPARAPATTGEANARPRTESWAESRHAELRAALGDRQCIRAIGIAADIEAREPAYYRSKLAGSKELEDCRAADRKATNRAGKRRDRSSERKAGDTPERGGSKAE